MLSGIIYDNKDADPLILDNLTVPLLLERPIKQVMLTEICRANDDQQ
jgi:hypothetical protein